MTSDMTPRFLRRQKRSRFRSALRWVNNARRAAGVPAGAATKFLQIAGTREFQSGNQPTMRPEERVPACNGPPKNVVRLRYVRLTHIPFRAMVRPALLT